MIFWCLLLSFALVAQEYEYNYTFFINSNMSGTYFSSAVSAKGQSSLVGPNNKLPVNEFYYHTPGNSLMLRYQNAPGGKWSASIFYREKRGMDHFKKSNTLSFWVLRKFDALQLHELPNVQLMRRDSSMTKAFQLKKINTNKWEQVKIPASSLIGTGKFDPIDFIAVVFSFESGNENSVHLLYIDDIEFINVGHTSTITALPVITSASDEYAKHIDITWEKITDKNVRLVKIYRSTDGKKLSLAGVQEPYINRFTDFHGRTGEKYFYTISFLDNNYRETRRSKSIPGITKTMTDDELLTMVQQATFRYYWEANEPTSGLARENIHGRQNMIASGASGFGIMALIVGTERKFISRKESVERLTKILNFLEKGDRFHGVYPHFLDGPTGKVEPFFGSRDNGADLVETSFLLQGLLAARQYFSSNDPGEEMIRDKITAIWEGTEWDWFKRYPDSKFLYWHWSPDQEWIIDHKLIGWNETMITYLLAIASPTHAVSPTMYYSGWANQDSTGIKYRSAWGQTTDGSMYTNGNSYFGVKLDVGVSTGGPLFFTHYSYMGYDPHLITDKYTNYFRNNQNIAKINYRYCVENPKKFKGYGDSAWGLTASDGPFHYSADEPVAWQDNGKITPTGAISSFPYLPEESMKALKNYYFNHGKFLWGEYGFKDAFDLTNNWCSDIYMGLNQAPMTVMIENYRTGLIWKLFMQNPEIKTGLKKINDLQ
jgi:hypothetical protein